MKRDYTLPSFLPDFRLLIRHNLIFTVVAGMLFAAATINAQSTGSVAGVVLNAEGTAIPSLTVLLMGTSYATQTAADGTFQIDVPAGTYTLRISGIGYRPYERRLKIEPGKTVRVRAVMDEVPVQMPGVEITADQYHYYKVNRTSLATKTSASLLETPASVEIVNAAQFEDQAVTRIDQVFAYMLGIQMSGTRGQSFILRGFETDQEFSTYTVDGMTGAVWRQHDPPAAIVDQIEYLKGPASVLYGITQPGGFINIVTKKPEATSSYSAEVQYGSYASSISGVGDRNSFSLNSDFTGPLNDDGSLRYRLILTHLNNQSFREVNDNSLYITPSLEWRPSDETSILAQVEIARDEGLWDEYLVAPGDDLDNVPPITTKLTEPTDYWWDRGVAISASLNHQLSQDWALRVGARRVDRTDIRRLFQHNKILPDGETLSRSYRDQFNERTYNFLDGNVEGHLSTGPIEHRLLAGIGAGYETIHFERRSLSGDSTMNINIYDPEYGQAIIPDPKPGFNRFWDNLFFGIYLQDQVQLHEMVQLVAGARFDMAMTEHEEEQAGLTFDKEDQGFSPRVGLVLQPLDEVSAYVQYSTSFAPTRAERENAEGNLDFDPELGVQLEVGVKADLLEGRLGGSAAFYDAGRDNVLARVEGTNPNGNAIYDQLGKVQSQGLEVELFLVPIEGWQVTGGYAMTMTEVLEDPTDYLIGAALPYVPENQGNLWTTYRFENGPLQGFGLSFGMIFMDERPTSLPDEEGNAFMLPSWTRLDGGLFWEGSGIRVAVNLENLADERYYSSGSPIRLVPGAPRSARVTWGFNW